MGTVPDALVLNYTFTPSGNLPYLGKVTLRYLTAHRIKLTWSSLSMGSYTCDGRLTLELVLRVSLVGLRKVGTREGVKVSSRAP